MPLRGLFLRPTAGALVRGEGGAADAHGARARERALGGLRSLAGPRHEGAWGCAPPHLTLEPCVLDALPRDVTTRVCGLSAQELNKLIRQTIGQGGALLPPGGAAGGSGGPGHEVIPMDALGEPYQRLARNNKASFYSNCAWDVPV